MFLSKRYCPAATLCCLLASGCVTHRTPVQVDDLLAQALLAAVTHHEFDQDPEAAVLIDSIAEVDPSYPELRELNEDIDPMARIGLEWTALGMNRKPRPQLERSLGRRALLWLPDRLLDLLDIVSFDVHFGPGAFADVHVTRALQVAGGFRATGGLGIHDQRSIGMKSQADAGLTLIALGTYTYGATLVGTSGTHGSTDSWSGLHQPSSPLYQELRDYWALGASATAVFIGAEADFHPLQLADFLAGLVGIDFLNDDFAHTRGLKLDPVEAKLIAEIRRLRRSEETVAAYLDAKHLPPASLTTPQPASSGAQDRPQLPAAPAAPE